MDAVQFVTSMPPADSVTVRFLVSCVRAVFDPAARREIDDNELANVDWELLAKFARESRVDVLLLHGLKYRSGRGIPAGLLQQLTEYEAANRRRNADSDAALIHLAGALAAADVEVIFFKGPLTARRFYSDPGLRFFWDLDFLVRCRDRAKVHDALLASGYVRYGELSPRERRLFERYHFADCYEPVSQMGPELDVHWALFPANFPMRLDDVGLWERAENFYLGQTRLSTLADVDAFVYAAIHGAKEEWRRLQMVADIAAMLTSGQAPDLSQCLARATVWGARRHLLLALHLARHLLGAPVPKALVASIDADPVIRELAEDVERRQALLTARGSSIFEFSAWRSRSFDTRRARLRYAWRTWRVRTAASACKSSIGWRR